MEKTIKNTIVYKAQDGKEFLSQDECEKYEKNVIEKEKNIKYFVYYTNRDLNETGLFYHKNYAAVYLSGYDSCYYEVLLQYLINRYNGKIIHEDVQGYGVTSAFEIQKSTKEEYFKKAPIIWGGSATNSEQILISEEPIDGYPENIKVVSTYLHAKK